MSKNAWNGQPVINEAHVVPPERETEADTKEKFFTQSARQDQDIYKAGGYSGNDCPFVYHAIGTSQPTEEPTASNFKYPFEYTPTPNTWRRSASAKKAK